jgi:two-component system sensor histidine kinase/response regulator
MITAFSRGISEPLPADSPFSDVLIKPIKQSELFDSIANAVRPKSGDVQLPQSPSPPSTEMTQSKLAANSQRILVAEDNAVNQLLTLTQLKKLGYHAQAVANGREAVEAVLTGTYDLVLMDCQMPEMDGLEATIKIRELEIGKKTRLTIIALTANAMKEDQDRCLRAGMDDYISKPVKKEILAKMLAKWLPENRKASEVL